MGAQEQVAYGAHGNAAGKGRVLHVHHVQFILVADKRGYNEAGYCNEKRELGVGPQKKRV